MVFRERSNLHRYSVWCFVGAETCRGVMLGGSQMLKLYMDCGMFLTVRYHVIPRHRHSSFLSVGTCCLRSLFAFQLVLSLVVAYHCFIFATHYHPAPPLSTAMDTKIQALHQAGRAALEKAAKFLPKDAEAPPEVLRCECLQRSCVVEHFMCICL